MKSSSPSSPSSGLAVSISSVSVVSSSTARSACGRMFGLRVDCRCGARLPLWASGDGVRLRASDVECMYASESLLS